MTDQRNKPAQVPVVAQVDSFVGSVLTRDRRDSLFASLPAHVKPERFERNLVTAVQNHPRLLQCDAQAVFNEVAKAAALGLYLDPTLGEAYLITGWSGTEKRLVPQLRLGYRGLIKLGRQSGEIAAIYAHAVHENDRFEVSMGTDLQLIHQPDFRHDRGAARLYYAVVKYRDGTVDFEPMSVEDIRVIRDRSDGYKAWIDKKITSTPWATDEGEMAKKTVLRRLMKRLPQSPEIGDALAIEDEDFREPAPAPPSLRSKLQAGHTAPRLGFSKEHVMQAVEEPAGAMQRVLGDDDVPTEFGGPTAEKIMVHEPAPQEPIAREVEAPQVAELRDPLRVPMADLTPDERTAWAEAFRAKVLKAGKSSVAAMQVWTEYYDLQLKPLAVADEILFVRLEGWMGERMKRLRAAEANP